MVAAVARLAVVSCHNINSLIPDQPAILSFTPKDLVTTLMAMFHAIVERCRPQQENHHGSAVVF